MWNFDVFLVVSLNKLLKKQLCCRCFKTPSCLCGIAIIDSFTVSLHNHNGRHLPVVRAVQGDCLAFEIWWKFSLVTWIYNLLWHEAIATYINQSQKGDANQSETMSHTRLTVLMPPGSHCVTVYGCKGKSAQETHDAIITSLWCQNNVATSFWHHNDIVCPLSSKLLLHSSAIIWGLWCQKQVSQVGISNCIPQNTVGCNYLPLPQIPASGTKVLIDTFTMASIYTCSIWKMAK